MSFFARPDLSSIQFKQLPDSVLALSGQTQIATISGLTLSDGNGSNVIITADQAASHVGDVLTYDGAGTIKLLPSGAGGDPIYPITCKSPAAITLGGINAGDTLSGCTLSYIIQQLLVPTLSPTLTAPSSIFSVLPLSNPYEVGTTLSVIGTTQFNKGSIYPQYTSASPDRSGGATSYNYVDFDGIVCNCPVAINVLTCSYSMPLYNVKEGVRCAYGSVSYAAGVQPKDSSGANYSTPLMTGTTSGSTFAIIWGIYPYFYGKVASSGATAGSNRPTPTCALVIGGTKVVADSTGTVSINFNSTSDDYIWFAIPSGSTKTCWYVNALNNGTIGGIVNAGGNLFPNCNSVSVVCGLWTNVCGGSPHTYNVYISNYQSAVSTLMTIS
jgi:hypothetical protein